MNVKTDTKERFSVITPLGPEISANMAEELGSLLTTHLKKQPPHVILNLENIETMAPEAAIQLTESAAEFMENSCSFVICSLRSKPLAMLEEMEIAEILNITPTESEAWDIVQMEEIERELLSDNDFDNES